VEGVRIAVVGGSLGGLTAACLLRDGGHDVTMHERAGTELEERGAGIGFLPETYRYLVERAGIPLDEISVATDHIRYLNRDDSVAHDATHQYQFSSWNTVYRRLLDHWGRERYHLGQEMVGFEQDADAVRVAFAAGDTLGVELLVCADGVGSTARRILQPAASSSYAGYVAWRGMVPEADLPPELTYRFGDAITYHVTANSHVLVYPIPGRDGCVAPGARLVNFVWYRNYLEGGDLADLMTDRDGVRRDLSLPPGAVSARHDTEARATARARLPTSIAAVIELTEHLFVQVIHDVAVDRMAFGRVCLLGDAAFAVRPHAAAGTAKAADDGWALAEALDAASDVPAALASWEPGRLAVGRLLLERTRRIGRRSQVDNTWVPGDPELIFGLHRPGAA